MLVKYTTYRMFVKDIVKFLNNEQIIVNDKYQRNYLKTEDKKFSSLLIDSIVNDLPIGNVFLAGNFADIQISKNNKVEILDGQQRLITLKRFINNEYELHYLKNYYNKNDDNDLIKRYGNDKNQYFLQVYKGKKYKDLPEVIKHAILNYEVLIVNYKPTEKEIKKQLSLFQRMNTLRINLTKQEIDYAQKNITDKFPNVEYFAFKLMETSFIKPENILKGFSKQKVDRKEHFNYYINLIIIVVDEFIKPDNLNTLTTINKYNEYFNSLDREYIDNIYNEIVNIMHITHIVFDYIGENLTQSSSTQGLFQLQIGIMIRIIKDTEIDIDWENIPKTHTKSLKDIYFDFLNTNKKVLTRLQPKTKRELRQKHIETLYTRFREYLLTIN